MTTNVVTAAFAGTKYARTRPLYQWNYGQILQFEDLHDLPETFTVHFSNQSVYGTAKTMVGNGGLVDIPDEYLTTGQTVYAWVFLHTGADDGETVYVVTIPVKPRSKPVEEEPTPIQQGTIDTAIAALNVAVTRTSESAAAAEESANEAETAKDLAEDAAQRALTSANEAAASAGEADISKDLAEDAAQRALTSANDAETSKSLAEGFANDALTSAVSASASSAAIQNMTVESETLIPGSSATVVKNVDAETGSVTLTFGIPKGETGERGLQGIQGEPGVSPTVEVNDISGGHRVTITDAAGAKPFDIMDGDDYILTAQDKLDIASKITIPVKDVRVNGLSVVSNDIANVPVAQQYPTSSNSGYGVVTSYADVSKSGVSILDGKITTFSATSNLIKAGTNDYTPIVPSNQHSSVFYGLAKAAGDNTQANSSRNVGSYTQEAKTAIQNMLDIPSRSDLNAKQDALTFDSAPTQNSTNPVTSGGVYNAITNISAMEMHICSQSEYDSQTRIPAIENPDDQTFYLVPSDDAETNDIFVEWIYANNAWERFGSARVSANVTDVQVNGTSILVDGVANVPVTSESSFGVAKVSATYGTGVRSDGTLQVVPASDAQLKGGIGERRPIAPYQQHVSAFYGLAKAAGDSTQSQSNNAVGTYTEDAKSAIKNMLGIQEGLEVVRLI